MSGKRASRRSAGGRRGRPPRRQVAPLQGDDRRLRGGSVTGSQERSRRSVREDGARRVYSPFALPVTRPAHLPARRPSGRASGRGVRQRCRASLRARTHLVPRAQRTRGCTVSASVVSRRRRRPGLRTRSGRRSARGGRWETARALWLREPRSCSQSGQAQDRPGSRLMSGAPSTRALVVLERAWRPGCYPISRKL